MAFWQLGLAKSILGVPEFRLSLHCNLYEKVGELNPSLEFSYAMYEDPNFLETRTLNDY